MSNAPAWQRVLLVVAPLALSCGGAPAAAPASASAAAPAPAPASVPASASAPALAPGVVARLLVGGDSRDDSAHVLPWAFHEAHARGAAAFVFLGDMELSPELDRSFARELALLDPIPFYPVLGNHEIRQLGFLAIGKAAAERAFAAHFLGNARTPVRSALPGRVVYSADLPGGVHFVGLDNVSQRGFGADQMAWLAADLADARAQPTTKHIVVGMHKPLAHNGVATHGMDADGAQAVAESDAALALFVKSHVELVIASHVHQFAELQQAGIRSYITGGLGAPLTRSGPEHAFHHFLQLDVADDGIRVAVVRFGGPPSIAAEGEDEVE
jgi:3',5'-cyclic AMP phosphodiesterase CpdA